MTDELKPCLAYPCEGYMKPNNYDAALECSSCQFVIADEYEYDALVAGRQQAIDAALSDLIHDLGGLYIHRDGHDLYNGAINDVARFIKDQLGTSPLAERDARIEELERELAEARKDAERYRWLRDEDNWGDDTGNRWAILGELTHGEFDNWIDAAMRQEGE